MVRIVLRCALIAMIWVGAVPEAAHGYAAVRVSIKFIVDASGNRPATGNLNMDVEIRNEVDQGNSILHGAITEFALNTVELVDLPGVSQWFNVAATRANIQALRAAAIAAPATYLWRDNAINVYINGNNGSGFALGPPDNDIILLNQRCGNTPSCILHEVGHSLNLLHTHELPTGDQCADTLIDEATWVKAVLCQMNFFGATCDMLSAEQRAQVDMTYNNIMSYHTDEPQRRISPCQMERISTQGWADRNRLYSRMPIYIDSSFTGTENGSFANPYRSLQAALNAGGLANRALVLRQGSYTTTQDQINADVTLVARSGPTIISRGSAFQVATVAEKDSNVDVEVAARSVPRTSRGAQPYVLPVDLEHSQNPQVRSMVRAAQDDDTTARKVMRKAAEAARVAAKESLGAILSAAEATRRQHQASALDHLREAERHATGDDKLALQLELAQRHRDARQFEPAVKYYELVADATNQEGLRNEARRLADECAQELRTQQGRP